MASAIARIEQLEPYEGGLAILLRALYSGPDIGVVVDALLVVPVSGTDQPAAIRTAMAAAVAAWPASVGYTWTVPGANMVLPTFQKG